MILLFCNNTIFFKFTSCVPVCCFLLMARIIADDLFLHDFLYNLAGLILVLPIFLRPSKGYKQNSTFHNQQFLINILSSIF